MARGINMGAITREEVEVFAARVLEELRLDWVMKWTKTSGGICLNKTREILIPERMIGQYPWLAKEYVLHEASHIFAVGHGVEFYEVYADLLRRFMVLGTTALTRESVREEVERAELELDHDLRDYATRFPMPTERVLNRVITE